MKTFKLQIGGYKAVLTFGKEKRQIPLPERVRGFYLNTPGKMDDVGVKAFVEQTAKGMKESGLTSQPLETIVRKEVVVREEKTTFNDVYNKLEKLAQEHRDGVGEYIKGVRNEI